MSAPGANGIMRQRALHFLNDGGSTNHRPIGVSEGTARAGVPEGSAPRRRQDLSENAGYGSTTSAPKPSLSDDGNGSVLHSAGKPAQIRSEQIGPGPAHDLRSG